MFLARVAEFRDWLVARPETVIAVVTHWGVLDALTQIEFANCEVRARALARSARALRIVSGSDAPLPRPHPPPAALFSAGQAVRARAARAGAARVSRERATDGVATFVQTAAALAAAASERAQQHRPHMTALL